jgi:hypothetical protein
MAEFQVLIEYSEGESYSDNIDVTIKGTTFRSNDQARHLFTKACLRVVNFFQEDLLIIEELKGEDLTTENNE